MKNTETTVCHARDIIPYHGISMGVDYVVRACTFRPITRSTKLRVWFHLLSRTEFCICYNAQIFTPVRCNTFAHNFIFKGFYFRRFSAEIFRSRTNYLGTTHVLIVLAQTISCNKWNWTTNKARVTWDPSSLQIIEGLNLILQSMVWRIKRNPSNHSLKTRIKCDPSNLQIFECLQDCV